MGIYVKTKEKFCFYHEAGFLISMLQIQRLKLRKFKADHLWIGCSHSIFMASAGLPEIISGLLQ